MMGHVNRIVLWVVISVLGAGCFRSPPPTRPAVVPTPLEAAGLHNLFRLNDRVYSGSSPEGDAGFRSLQHLGIRTIITVDGATPDWRKAGKFGIRYVHLPVGYDGIPRGTGLQIAKAVHDLPGPVYIHCHHGKHRGPAAAACALLALEPTFTPDAAESWLEKAGTDPKYRGLMGLPHSFHRPTPLELTATPTLFPRTAKVADFTRLMVEIDEHWEALKLAKATGWKQPPDHPDIDPAHEAVLLMEAYREGQRLPGPLTKDQGFRTMLQEAEAAAARLEQALRSEPSRADAAFRASQSLCNQCHARWRDQP